MNLKEVQLPSGRVLKITVAPFDRAKLLYQAFLEELKGLRLDPEADVDVNLYKDIFCVGLSSKKIEQSLSECLKSVTIDDLKIDGNTFEKVEHRDDYFTVIFEVAKENIQPFTKSLFAKYEQVLQTMQNALASRQKTTP